MKLRLPWRRGGEERIWLEVGGSRYGRVEEKERENGKRKVERKGREEGKGEEGRGGRVFINAKYCVFYAKN